jgi:hypothetical protein
MRVVARWCYGKAEDASIAKLLAMTTTRPGRRMGDDPRRHGGFQAGSKPAVMLLACS